MPTRVLTLAMIGLMAMGLAACSAFYRDQILPPTDQELQESRDIKPRGAMRDGVFHMQRVEEGSSVRLEENIQLKRPDLPPFDVAYISRNVETVILELANAAGESVVIPQGLRNRTVTVVHSGADFKDMMDIVLGKVGYHYNYVDGVWYITRYPIRSYVLEVGQSERTGNLMSSTELSPETGVNGGGSSSSSDLSTNYTDELWSQVEATLEELIHVGELDPADGTASSGVSGSGQMLSPRQANNVQLLEPPSADGENGEVAQEDLFGTLTEGGGLNPNEVAPVATTDHLAPEEEAKPWYKITRSAGLITVRGAPEGHRLIEDYLEQVQEAALKQIFVEVRIVAIIRDRTTDRGSDFSKNLDLGDTVLGTLGFQAANPVNEAQASGAFLSAFSQKTNGERDLTAIVQALSTLGNVYTISSPSLLARNNQLSRVSLTRQLGYAETEVDQNTTTTGEIVIGSRVDTARFKNAGTVLSVFPYIGKSKVQMRFRLAVASKSGDTAIQTSIGDETPITNLVPELSNNVIDQDMVLEYGRVYAVGGLIETSTGVDKTYIPGLAEMPGMAEVFQRANNSKQDTEFIVLLRLSRA